MFKREYQGGSHVMVLSAQGRDPTANCKLTGKVNLKYDKVVRGYVHVLDGDSTSTRIQLPASDRTSLGLLQPFLVLQTAIQREARFAIDLCLLDTRGTRRRVTISSSVREPSISTLTARIPFVTMATGQWCNFCFDLSSLMAELFPGHTHKSLESFGVGGACLLRRVFTMRECPRDDVVGVSVAGEIPQACQMVINLSPIPTHVMSSVARYHPKTAGDHSVRGNEQEKPDQPPPTHVAFGKKVTVPRHVLARQTGSRNAGRKPRQSGMTSHHLSGPTTAVEGGVGVAGVGLSGRSQKQSAEGVRGDFLTKNVQRLTQREEELVTSMVHSDTDMELGQAGSSSRQVTSTAHGNKETGDREREQLFSYFSPPRTASSIHTPSEQEAGGDSSKEDVELARDFLPHRSTAGDNEQGNPLHSQSDAEDEELSSSEEVDDDVIEKGIPPTSELALDLNQTRLSDDYDWRQYASQEATPPSPSSPNTHLHISHHGNSSTPEHDNSTYSMTEQPTAQSLMDSLDIREMGGALSPTEDQESGNRSVQTDEDELELMYDPLLRCFYDPLTHKYYELIQ